MKNIISFYNKKKALFLAFIINRKKSKNLPKGYERKCGCGNIYIEYYDPTKRILPLCDDCLPF